MVGYLLVSTVLIKLNSWIESKKCPMKDQCAICCGQTLMIDADGESLQEVLAIPLDKIYQSSLITLMA